MKKVRKIPAGITLKLFSELCAKFVSQDAREVSIRKKDKDIDCILLLKSKLFARLKVTVAWLADGPLCMNAQFSCSRRPECPIPGERGKYYGDLRDLFKPDYPTTKTYITAGWFSIGESPTELYEETPEFIVFARDKITEQVHRWEAEILNDK